MADKPESLATEKGECSETVEHLEKDTKETESDQSAEARALFVVDEIVEDVEKALKEEQDTRDKVHDKKEEPLTESDSDVLVIDIDDHDESKRKQSMPDTARPIKRKRSSVSKSDDLSYQSILSSAKKDDEFNDRPAKVARNDSSKKKFDKVENELEAMFADSGSAGADSKSINLKGNFIYYFKVHTLDYLLVN